VTRTLKLATSRSPQDPDRIVAERTVTDAASVAALSRRARSASREWAAQPPTLRSSALHAAADRLAAAGADLEDLIVDEVGKPRAEARAEVARSVSIVRYYAQQVFDPVGNTFTPAQSGLLYTDRRPYGVAGLITPWNFPLAIPLWKASPALAAGNAVVVKPSTEALGCALRLAELFGPALPDDVFTVVVGERETAEALIHAADVISFTGSTAVGRSVAVAATMRSIPVQAEMGGNNAAVVLPDADPERAANLIAGAATGYAGQKCTATRRVIVVGDPGPILEALQAAFDSVVIGTPDREDVTVGPLITERARATFQAALDEARAAGGRLIGRSGALLESGWFVTPTLIDGLAPDHPLTQEETFGPMLIVLAAETTDQAVELANATRFGLTASVHGRDIETLLRAADRFEAGLIKINAPTTGVDFHLPFGGVRNSGIGPREQGKAAMDFYSATRTVSLR
jgi:aldehyde dehydrogenase (NAD+)